MTPDVAGAPSSLLEREREVGVLVESIRACAHARGGTVLVEGPAGIGKTTLLQAARELGHEAGFRVVGARGAEFEASFPYGIVRQFFESFLFTLAADERPRWLRETEAMSRQMRGGGGAPPEPADEFALLHSLYWMCVNIADERPLMMMLDDAQWADAPSLKFVEFTSRRLDQLPFMFVLATRLPDELTPAPLVSMLGDPRVQLIRPTPLSFRAVQQIVRERVDPTAHQEFALACHEATSGNPFLLQELVHEILRENLPATATSAERVRAIGPRGVSRMVLLRLRQLPDTARRLASILSVVGDGVSLSDLGRVAELDEAAVREALLGLEKAELVDLRDGIRFIHPVIRASVHEDLPAVERSELHQRFATIRRQQGHPPFEVAAHLLHVEPAEDEWVVQALRDAALQAERAGDFRAAAAMLQRARRERTEKDRDPALLADLGRVEARAGDPAGAEHLRAALELSADDQQMAEVAGTLANVLKFSGLPDEAADVLLDTLERLRLEEGPLRRRLQAELLGTRFISASPDARVDAAVDGASVPLGEPSDLLDSFLLAQSAFDSVAQLRPAEEAIRAGRAALSGHPVIPDPALGGQVVIVASVALIWAEDFDFVERVLSQALADARAAGSILALGNFTTMRAMCAYRSGALLQAETDAATVLDLAPEAEGLQTLLPPAVAYASLAGLERGTPIEELLERALDPRLDAGKDLLPFTQLLWARGELLLAGDQPERALAAFRACDLPAPGHGAANPSMVPWREGAALALARLGEEREAARLAAEAVRRAEIFGSSRAVGVALRARALVATAAERLSGLLAAVERLERASSSLELARARIDLGAALRAAGRRVDAQRVLEAGHESAIGLGAQRLAERAAAELAAAGVRPRRTLASGLAALTPSERRVAELAAQGQSNREIAQTLFVTEKTVETHLGHVYDKLGVRSRRKLPEVLRLPAAA